MTRKPKEKPKKKVTAPKRKPTSTHRQSQAAFNRAATAARQEIGPLPEVKDLKRRNAALASFRTYCETYHAPTFYLAWSRDQLKALDRVEECVLHGGLFALAMTRGGGKTAIARRAVEWGVLTGIRHFPMLVGATEPLAARSMRSIKKTFSSNELLLQDFPEICYPIWALEGETRRCIGQTLDGRRTQIIWGSEEIRLPDVPGLDGRPTAWATIWSRGVTGAIRGANVNSPDGGEWRPDFVIPDDVQTRESAKSFQQTNDLELIIDGDVLELAGPDKKIAAVMPCTVIYQGDLTSRYLDPSRHPEWRGERFKAVYSFPTNTKLWEEYASIREESFRSGGKGNEATEFYAERRAEMDAGATIAWDGRKKEDELSALQSAMNVKIDKPKTFAAEWQNEPETEASLSEVPQIQATDLLRKMNGIPRGRAPRTVNKLTAFIDVQAEVLFWAVCGWSDRFGGALIDYGAWPEQPISAFEAATPARPLSAVYAHMERSARILAGLNDLSAALFGKQIRQHEADGVLSLSMMLIDIGFEADAVHSFISASPFRPLMMPSKGAGLSADRKALDAYRNEPGDKRGWNWRIEAKTTSKGRFVYYDTYPWKSFLAESILAPAGSLSSFHFAGEVSQDERRRDGDFERQHPLLKLHLLSEHRKPTWGQDRRVEVWRLKGGDVGSENHYWDCCVGAAVAASVSGTHFSASAAAGMPQVTEPQKTRVSDREQYDEQRRRFEANRMGAR